MLLELPNEIVWSIMAEALGWHELVAWTAVRLTCRALHAWVAAARQDDGTCPWWREPRQAARMLDLAAGAHATVPLFSNPLYMHEPVDGGALYTRSVLLLLRAVEAGHAAAYRALSVAHAADARRTCVQEAALVHDRPWAFEGDVWDDTIVRMAIDAGAVRILGAYVAANAAGMPSAMEIMHANVARLAHEALGALEPRGDAPGPRRVLDWLAGAGHGANDDACGCGHGHGIKRRHGDAEAAALLPLAADGLVVVDLTRADTLRGYVRTGDEERRRAATHGQRKRRWLPALALVRLLPDLLLTLLERRPLVVRFASGRLCDAASAQVVELARSRVTVCFTEPADHGTLVNGDVRPPRTIIVHFSARPLGACGAYYLATFDPVQPYWIDLRSGAGSGGRCARATTGAVPSLRALAAEALARRWDTLGKAYGVSAADGHSLVRRDAHPTIPGVTAYDAVLQCVSLAPA